MHSMTGFGKADAKNKDLEVAVEVYSVNSRFLEYLFRLPKQLFFMEPKLKEHISKRVSRGKISLSINYTDFGSGLDKLIINETMADELNRQLLKLQKKYKISGEPEIKHFLQFPDIFRIEKAEDIEEKIWPVLISAVDKALNGLIRMRKREGNNLKKDLTSRMTFLSDRINKVEKLAPQNVVEYREKLAGKIENVLADGTINGNRFEEEVAFMAEKADITEECVRFKSHIKQFRAALKAAEPVGKRLNFILQEFNREVNTIGSKAGHMEISNFVLELKEEIEKMREQVQNIE
jgi:uncharacterized protein (TIGR00255 family)